MTYLVAVPIEGGPPVAIEIDEITGGGVARAARPGETVATLTTSFGAELERLQPMAQAIITKLRGLADSPDEVSVEFGIKMNVEAGLVIARSSAEANFKVTMLWSRK
jgi:hypothetical protein